MVNAKKFVTKFQAKNILHVLKEYSRDDCHLLFEFNIFKTRWIITIFEFYEFDCIVHIKPE